MRPLRVIFPGFVWRNSGFGQSIFVTHPNGFTTLYAHPQPLFLRWKNMSGLSSTKRRAGLLNDFPKDRFPVSKGQFIALSGNTGGSGAHLHFEIHPIRNLKPA